MMDRSVVLAVLALFTLLAGMAVAAYQLWAAENAKQTGSQSFKNKTGS